MTLDVPALVAVMRTIRPVERQQAADSRQWRKAPISAAERMEQATRHEEYGGSRDHA